VGSIGHEATDRPRSAKVRNVLIKGTRFL
jgi:hypothetical protein